MWGAGVLPCAGATCGGDGRPRGASHPFHTTQVPHQASRLNVVKHKNQHTAHGTRDRYSRVWRNQQRVESCLRACIARVVPAATNTGGTPGGTPTLLFLRRLHCGGPCSSRTSSKASIREALEGGSTPKACAEADKAPGLRYDDVEPVPTTSLRRLRCE